MLKNNVFRPDVNTVKWFKAAGIRAIKSIAQTAIALIGTASVFESVNWQMVISASLLSGVLSMLTSISGIPEVQNEDTETK